MDMILSPPEYLPSRHERSLLGARGKSYHVGLLGAMGEGAKHPHAWKRLNI